MSLARLPDAYDYSELETELINLFVRLVRILGLPKSLAEIYAVFFASPAPLSMDEIIARGRLSQGAVSQGIRQLRSFGAIRPVHVAGNRKTFYEVEENLRKVAAGFLKEQVLPQIEDWPQRLQRIEKLEHDAHGGESARIAKLRGWHRRVAQSMPELLQLIGKWS